MIDGEIVPALAPTLGAVGVLQIALAWTVCSIVVSLVLGLMLSTGRSDRS